MYCDTLVSIGTGTSISLGLVSTYSPALAPDHGSFLPIIRYTLLVEIDVIKLSALYFLKPLLIIALIIT
jgi:hypothetical protein